MRDYIGYSSGEWIPDSQFSMDPDDTMGVVLSGAFSLISEQSAADRARSLCC